MTTLRWFGGRRHVFYDTPSSPARAEAVLLASDFVMLAAPTFLATAILHRPSPAADAVFLALWLMIPRALARCLAWMERPREPMKVYAASAGFVLTVSVLLFAGWELIYTENRKYVPIGHGTAGAVMLAWIVTIFLFQPRTYRLYDFLCGGVLLLALLEAKPEAWLWVPLFLAALLVSAATRHLLLDVAQGSRRRRIPLQNARVLAVCGALASCLAFFALYFVLHRGLDFPGAADLAGAETAYRYSSPLIARTPDGLPWGARETESPGGAELVSREQRGYRLRILSYASRPDSQKVAWRVRPVGELGELPGWPPRPGVLWRALSLSTFDPEDDAWVETSPLRETSWPAGRTLRVDAPPSSAGDPTPLDLEYRVELPIFRNLVAMYRHRQWTADWIRSIERSGAGDIFPSPALRPGSVYHARSRLEYPNPGPFPEERGGAAELDARAWRQYLSLPDPATLGLDLRPVAAGIFAGSSTVGDRVHALERYFRTGSFFYRRDEVWSGSGAPYRRFFEETRIGNCTHYATSGALLLRAGGVRTRFVAGFVNGEWDAATRSVALQVSMAHAWIEVHVPGRGWYAVDPTAWVPRAADAPRGQEPGVPLPAAADESLAGGPSRGGAARTGVPSGPDFEGENRPLTPEQRTGPELAAEGGTGRSRWRGESAGGAAAGEEDYSSWFEFTRLPRGGDGPEGPGVSGTRGGELPAAEELAARGGRGWSEESAPSRHDGRKLGIALRILILATGALVALLVLVTYRFARKRQEEAEAGDVEDDGEELEDPFDQALATEVELYGESTPRGAIVAEYQRLQRDLARTRNHRRRHQTPREHGSWLARRFQEIRGSLKVVIDLLYRAVYASEDVTDDDARSHGESCRRVRKYMR